MAKSIKLKVKSEYNDKELGRYVGKGETITVESPERAWSLSRVAEIVYMPQGFKEPKVELSKGLSFLICGRNQAGIVEDCLLSIAEIADEIIFVDNNSEDSTFEIVSALAEEYPNIKVFKYTIPAPKSIEEQRESVKMGDGNTIGTYYNFCLGKATKNNVIKWDSNFIATKHLKEMIKKHRLKTRIDKFSLWFAGEEEDRGEFRCFSKKHGFKWKDTEECENPDLGYIDDSEEEGFELSVFLKKTGEEIDTTKPAPLDFGEGIYKNRGANKKHICIFNNWNPKIGGVKTAVIQLGKALDREGYRVTIATNSKGSEKSTLAEYSTFSQVVFLEEGKSLECDVCIMASNHEAPQEIKTYKWLQWVHTDYTQCEEGGNLMVCNKDIVQQYIGVSDHVSNIARELYDLNITTIHNFLVDDYALETEESQIRFITVARIGPEKGFERMSIFAQKLAQANIDFSWDIYGDGMPQYEKKAKEWFKPFRKVFFKGVVLNLKREVADSDYLVQLSDYEGFPYTVLESLVLGTPALVTDYPGASEIIEDGVNGYILPMDAEKITEKEVDKIVNNIPKFKHKQTGGVKQWIQLF